MMNNLNRGRLASPLLFLALCAQASALEPSKVQVVPSRVEMGTFYGGAKVHVAGVASAGNKVIVVVRGPSTAEVFNKISHVGPIWVNTGKVTVSGVPSLQLIFTSQPLQTCLNAAALDRYQLDLDSLKKRMQIESKAPDKDRIAEDFLAFKARRATYRITSGGVQMGASNQGELAYRLDFEMPRSAKPGQYRVSVLECRNGDVARQSEVEMDLVEVGFPALIARLAKEQAPLYGILAIIIAMLAGFGIDFIVSRIFKRRAGAH